MPSSVGEAEAIRIREASLTGGTETIVDDECAGVAAYQAEPVPRASKRPRVLTVPVMVKLEGSD